MWRTVSLACLVGCSSGSIGTSGDSGARGDTGASTGDLVSGDGRAGDPGSGDPESSGDPVSAGDPAAGDPLAGGDPHVSASVRYVDPQIAPANCTTYDPGTRACGAGAEPAHKTLAGAAAAAAAGETVLIRAGSYNEPLAPGQSGAPGLPITYRNYGNETVSITGASLAPAVEISGRQYLIIEGLEVVDVQRWLYARNAHHNIIGGNTFRGALDSGGSSKTGLFFEEATFNRILDNTIDDSTQDNLSLINSDYNLVEGNTFRRAAHTLWTIKCGDYNILRANDFHNEVQKIGEIYDCDGVGFDHQFTILDSTRHNLVEQNDFAYTASSGDSSPYSGIQYAGQQGIIRRNRFYDTTGPALQMALYGGEAETNTDNRVYHNAFVSTDFAGVEISGGNTFSGNRFDNNIFARSIFVANDTRWSWYTGELDGEPVQIKIGRTDGFVFESNCVWGSAVDELYLIVHGARDELTPEQTVSWWQTNHPTLFIGTLEVEPAFENEGANDFRLASGSNLINAGRFLTTAVGAGSGTTLTVADALYFVDGFGIPGETGDIIQLQGDESRAVITHVDYATNTLTLATPLTWNDGQGASLAYEGSAPDVGAYEMP